MIPGYSRYHKYYNEIKSNSRPLEYLAKQDSIYFSVQKVLSEVKPDCALELGFGLGYTTYALNPQGIETIRVDLTESAINAAKEKFGDFYVNSDAFQYLGSIEKSFDLIIVNELIEHVQNPKKFISDLMNVAPKSHILITTPNKGIWRSLSWKTDNAPVHLHWFSETTFAKLIGGSNRQYGFVDFTDYHKAHPFYINFSSLSGKNASHVFNEDGTIQVEVTRKIPFRQFFYRLYYAILMFLRKDVFRAEATGKTLAVLIRPIEYSKLSLKQELLKNDYR